MKFLNVHGVYDYAGFAEDSLCALAHFAFHFDDSVGTPIAIFSKLDTQPIHTPAYASPDTSRCPMQNSGLNGCAVTVADINLDGYLDVLCASTSNDSLIAIYPGAAGMDRVGFVRFRCVMML